MTNKTHRPNLLWSDYYKTLVIQVWTKYINTLILITSYSCTAMKFKMTYILDVIFELTIEWFISFINKEKGYIRKILHE
jgi:hypothetical protein